jgi:hypothetical protein
MKFKSSKNKKINYSIKNVSYIRHIKKSEESSDEDLINNISIDNININSTKYINIYDTLYGLLFISTIYCFYSNYIAPSF